MYQLSQKISTHGEITIARPTDSMLLRSMLNKFLRYRLLGETEMGWKELQKDLRHCEDNYFFYSVPTPKRNETEVLTGKFPIQQIEATVKESLGPPDET